MAEHPIIMDQKQLKLTIARPGQPTRQPTESVVETAPQVSEGKETFGQKISEYAFGEKVAEPGKYIWKSYLEPTGKRVANDIVEHFLLLVKHTFQRWIWNGKGSRATRDSCTRASWPFPTAIWFRSTIGATASSDVS